jgi:hypothetical protein
MAGFVQVIEYRTSRIDEIQALAEQFRSSMPADVTAAAPRKITVTADRDREGYYVTIAEFDSYETAMENSKRPETTEFAARLAELCDGPPRFYNLDVIQSWEA